MCQGASPPSLSAAFAPTGISYRRGSYACRAGIPNGRLQFETQETCVIIAPGWSKIERNRDGRTRSGKNWRAASRNAEQDDQSGQQVIALQAGQNLVSDVRRRLEPTTLSAG